MDFTLQAFDLRFKLQMFHFRRQAVLEQILRHLETLFCQGQVLFDGTNLRHQFLNILAALGYRLGQSADRRGQLAAAGIEILTLGADLLGAAFGGAFGEDDFLLAERLCFEAGLQQMLPIQADLKFFTVDPGCRQIEQNKRCAFADNLSIANVDFLDDAAFQMLDRLEIAQGDDLTFGDGHFFKLGEVGPNQDRGKQDHHWPGGDSPTGHGMMFKEGVES